MTRKEFEQSMTMMCKALGIAINPTQANTFFDEFKHHDTRDFAHACRELSMGQPGYLPKLVFFRDNVVAAKEMRQARESTPYVPEIDSKRVFSQWRESEPEMAGKSDWEKGQVIMNALKRKTDHGEAIYTLREEDSFAFWNEAIPLSQKADFGHKEPWIRWIPQPDGKEWEDRQYRWIKTKWRQKGEPRPQNTGTVSEPGGFTKI
jgi:hypothetical protein